MGPLPFRTSYKGWKQQGEWVIKPLAFFLSELPIRDGNFLWGSSQMEDPSPFRTSYKGWKQFTVEEIDGLATPFRTSYKGWKLSHLIISLYIQLPFRTSYKGWKREKDNPRLSIRNWLSELPIRDGNMAQVDMSVSEAPLSELPIRDGNETV